MSKKNFFAGRRIVEIGFREQVKQTKKKGPQDRNKRDRNRKDEPEFRKVFRPVWVQSASGWPKSKYYEHIPLGTEETPIEKKAEIYQDLFNLIEPNLNYKWPKYDTDYKRIRGVTREHKNLSIIEVFNEIYNSNYNFSQEAENIINNAPAELRVGDVVSIPVRSITKDSVLFDTLNYKQVINCNTNLYKYENFKKFIPKDPIKVRVVSTDHNRVTVDPISPMFDEWLMPIIKDPSIQRVMPFAQTIKVKNLYRTHGGYVGRAIIPNVSGFVGEDYTVEAFIPGSQIVLNIEKDFEKWNGKEVDAFVTSYIPKPNSAGQMSLICSVKEYLKFIGDMNLVELFNIWCDSDARWEAEKNKEYAGVVTGILYSSKKCGVYVEIPELYITGMVNTSPSELCNYKPQDSVTVRIADMEEDTRYDSDTEQLVHEEPYVIEGDILKKCSVKPVLQFVNK